MTWPTAFVSSIFGGKGRLASSAFAMMFCSFGGEKCATAAIFCHKCGKKISLSVDKENGSPSGVHCEQKTSASKAALNLCSVPIEEGRRSFKLLQAICNKKAEKGTGKD